MKRRHQIQGALVLAMIPVAIEGYIMLDRWQIERRQMIAQVRFEEEVRDCQETGGRWWRGNCEYDQAR